MRACPGGQLEVGCNDVVRRDRRAGEHLEESGSLLVMRGEGEHEVVAHRDHHMPKTRRREDVSVEAGEGGRAHPVGEHAVAADALVHHAERLSAAPG